MTVTVPAEQFDQQVNERLQQAARQIRLPGFRPGKVPLKEVRRRFEPGVRAEVAGEVMQQSFFQAVQDESLRPAGQPRLEPVQMDAGNDFEFAATFEVMPEIELAELNTIKVEKPVSEVTEADIDTMIERLREQRQTFEEREGRAAEEGDQVVVDFRGFLGDEEAEGTAAEDQELVLGSGRMIPGFEDALVGMQAGEDKSFEVTFPEDYGNETLKGQTVRFEAAVKSVAEPTLPELNADFFAEFGVEGDELEDFRKEVRENMERELENACRTRVKNQVMDGLHDLHQVDAPSALVSEQIHSMQHDMVQRFGGQGMDPHSLPEELFRDQAERRVRLGLILNRIVEVHEVQPSDERIEEILDDLAARYDEPEMVKEWYHSQPEQLEQIRSLALEDAVVDFVLDQADVTESQQSYEEVLAAASGQGAGSEEEEDVDADDQVVGADAAGDDADEDTRSN